MRLSPYALLLVLRQTQAFVPQSLFGQRSTAFKPLQNVSDEDDMGGSVPDADSYFKEQRERMKKRQAEEEASGLPTSGSARFAELMKAKQQSDIHQPQSSVSNDPYEQEDDDYYFMQQQKEQQKPDPTKSARLQEMMGGAGGGMGMGMGGPPIVNAGEKPPPPQTRRREISNTSDVYLEQLKADTNKRQQAIKDGDWESANRVWEAEEIEELKTYFKKNPYLQDQIQKQNAMLGTSEDEMLIFTKEEKKTLDKSDSGISYREKLAARQGKFTKNSDNTIEPQMPVKSDPSKEQPVFERLEAPENEAPKAEPILPEVAKELLNPEPVASKGATAVTLPPPQQSARLQEMMGGVGGGMGMGMGGPPIVNAGEKPPPPQTRRREISNTSDVYLEQLKADTNKRQQAIKDGDWESANRVWEAEEIEELKDYFKKNPYLQDQVKRQSSMLGTSEDEMLIFTKEERKMLDKSDSGISYKEKLASRQEKKTISEPVSERKEGMPQNIAEPTQDVKSVELASEVAPPVTATSSSDDAEALRRQLRTFMGLILKHRGGPGFGSGRLEGPDVKRFEETFVEIKNVLAAESGIILPEVVEEIEEPKNFMVESAPQVAPYQLVTPYGPSDPLYGSLECVDAVIRMYKSSSSDEKLEFVPTLKDALTSAVMKCDEVLGGGVSKGTDDKSLESFGDIAAKMDFSISSIPADEKRSASVDNQALIVTEEEEDHLTKNIQKVLESLKGDGRYGLKDSISDDEAEKLETMLLEMKASLLDQRHGGAAADEETIITEGDLMSNVKEILNSVKGNGRFGLKESVSTDEASKIEAVLLGMKDTLLDELNLDEPPTSSVTPSSLQTSAPKSIDDDTSNSKYKQMLAKKKASKLTGN